MKKLVLALTALAVVLFGAVAPGTASAYPPGSTTTIPVTEATLPDTGAPGTTVLPDTGGSGAPGTTLPTVLPDTGGSGVPGGGLPDTGGSGSGGGALPSTGSGGISTNLAIGGVSLLVGIGLLVVAGIRRRNTATPSPA